MLAPNTFLTAISFVRLTSVNVTIPNIPRKMIKRLTIMIMIMSLILTTILNMREIKMILTL